jgi:hypothetical protein
MKKLWFPLLLVIACSPLLQAQDRFPSPVPTSGISVELGVVAVVPDSSPGLPPRISVLTQDPSARLFANDQRGPLYTIDEESGNVTEYLDLRDYPDLAVLSTSEAGFQSFAFHPEFFRAGESGFGRFYTIHSSNNTTPTPDFNPRGSTNFHTVLLEWRTNQPAANVFTAADAGNPYREMLRFKQRYGNHNGGLIAFNPTVIHGDSDYGNLYVALGDGGLADDPLENGQNPSNPYGSILRLDPLGNDGANGQYGIVADNALAADNDANTLPEIFSYGLRNPQRFGWDAVTGDCFIADIGQSDVEEINLAANGANFGWNIREGSFPFKGSSTAGLTDPVAEYDHSNTVIDPPTPIANRAITVGEVARGTCVPQLEGMLPLADFPTGLIFLLDVDNDPLDGGQDGLSELTVLDADGDPARFLELINAARADRGLSATTRADLRFSVNTPGRIYLTNKHDGLVRRITPVDPPTIAISGIINSRAEVQYTGTLQSSSDLGTWQDLVPQPASPWEFSPAETSQFFRSICR